MNRREFIMIGSVAGAGFSMQSTSLPKGLLVPAELRKPMPVFSLPDLDGKVVQSGDFRGNVIILRFWATW